MANENTDVVFEQGGATVTVKSGGKIVIQSGGELEMEAGSTLTNDGTQAGAIADPSGGGTQDAEARTAINAIIDALEGAGIIVAS